MKSLCQILIDGDTDEIVNSLKDFAVVDKNERGILIEPYNIDESDFVNKVASILAKLIIDKYEEGKVLKIIETNYGYFDVPERREILEKTFNFLRYDKSTGSYNKRVQIIKKDLCDYLMQNDSLIIEGFVNFRLGEYKKELEQIVEKVVEEYITYKEYTEFIGLLRYFVEIQAPKCKEVHILVNQNKGYTILDEKLNDITKECIDEFLSEVKGLDVGFDDLLISALITLAPLRVYIHNSQDFKNQEIIKTICEIFVGRTTICEAF